MTGISAFVVCQNEAASIERCLASLAWCDEIVVVDSGSTDATLDICARHNCRIDHREWTGYVEQKSHALSLCTQPWILNLDADEEVSPELRDDIRAMLEEQKIEIAPLAFMRGRTLKNAYIVADEMQNSSMAQVKMLLTRIGEGSKIVITGDMDQTDHKKGSNGLVDLCERLQKGGVKGITVCELDERDVQRHHLIKDILKLYVD